MRRNRLTLYFPGIWGLPSGVSLYFKSDLRVEIRDVVGSLELVEFAHHLTFSS